MITNYTLHNKSVVSDLNIGQEKDVVAKHIISDSLERFYLRVDNGHVINPLEISIAELRKIIPVFVETSENNYTLYHKAIHGQTRTGFKSLERIINA